MSETTEFVPFPKMARLSREIIVTEKIDGTNGQIYIGEDGEFLIGSRTRWITPEMDNHGFARWATDHKDELMQLGPAATSANGGGRAFSADTACRMAIRGSACSMSHDGPMSGRRAAMSCQCCGAANSAKTLSTINWLAWKWAALLPRPAS